LKREKSLTLKEIYIKLTDLIPKKIIIDEKEIEALAKNLIEKGFLEYNSEKKVYIYIP